MENEKLQNLTPGKSWGRYWMYCPTCKRMTVHLQCFLGYTAKEKKQDIKVHLEVFCYFHAFSHHDKEKDVHVFNESRELTLDYTDFVALMEHPAFSSEDPNEWG